MTKIEELAQIANLENGLGDKAVTKAVEHYKAAGDALLQIWEQLKYGEKEEWLETNWNYSHRRAYQLMALAENWEGVIRGRDKNKPLSLRYALKLIQDLIKEPKTDPRENPFDVRKFLKGHISRSITKHITYWTPEALFYLGKRQNRFQLDVTHLDKWLDQMQHDVEPIADVLYGWTPEGFIDGYDVDNTTEKVVSQFAGKTLSPYQKDALTEYFKTNYDDVAASRWPEYWFGEDDGVDYSTIVDDEPVPPPAPSQHARKVNEDAADAAYRAQQKRKKWRTT